MRPENFASLVDTQNIKIVVAAATSLAIKQVTGGYVLKEGKGGIFLMVFFYISTQRLLFSARALIHQNFRPNLAGEACLEPIQY